MTSGALPLGTHPPCPPALAGSAGLATFNTTGLARLIQCGSVGPVAASSVLLFCVLAVCAGLALCAAVLALGGVPLVPLWHALTGGYGKRVPRPGPRQPFHGYAGYTSRGKKKNKARKKDEMPRVRKQRGLARRGYLRYSTNPRKSRAQPCAADQAFVDRLHETPPADYSHGTPPVRNPPR